MSDNDLKVEVYWADLPLHLAARYAADRAVYWETTRLPIMHAFSYTPDDYWDLTVAEHADMCTYLGLEKDDADG